MTINKRYKSLLLIFFGQFLVYGIVVVNTRAFTDDNYELTALSAMLLAAIYYYIIRKITRDDEDKLALVVYVLGGVIGSLISMYISKHYLNI